MASEFPTPETVDVLAEVSEYLTRRPRTVGHPATVLSLARFVGHYDRYRDRFPLARMDEREAMIRLAAHAVARVHALDRVKR